MGDIQFWLSMAALPIALVAMFFGLISYCGGRHFDASMSLHYYKDEKGQDQLGQQIQTRQEKTFLGHTIGPIGIALARRSFDKEFEQELRRFRGSNT